MKCENGISFPSMFKHHCPGYNAHNRNECGEKMWKQKQKLKLE